MIESDIESLRRRLAEANENLCLIYDRMSQFVQETNVPLELIKDKRRLEQEIETLQARYECLRSLPQPASEPELGNTPSTTEPSPEPDRGPLRIPIPRWRSRKVWVPVIVALIGLAVVTITIIPAIFNGNGDSEHLTPPPATVPPTAPPPTAPPPTTPPPTTPPPPTACTPIGGAIEPFLCAAGVSVQINGGAPSPVTYEGRLNLKAGDTLNLVNLCYCTSSTAPNDGVAGEAYLFLNRVETYTYGLFTRGGPRIREICGNAGDFEGIWTMERGHHRVVIALMHYFSRTVPAAIIPDPVTECERTGDCEVDDRFYINLDVE